MRALQLLVTVVCLLMVREASAAEITDRVLFDFEEAADVAGWKNLELPDAKTKEPSAKIERVAENAASGKHSLKITFAGGAWPTVITSITASCYTATRRIGSGLGIAKLNKSRIGRLCW